MLKPHGNEFLECFSIQLLLGISFSLHMEEFWVLGKSWGGMLGREISPRKGVTQILWPRDFCLPTFPQILCKLPAHKAALNVQCSANSPGREE